MHDAILEDSGGIAGYKDEGALDSALHAPIRSVNKKDAYPTFFDKVSALGYLIASNHAFNDANKRTALLLMSQTLEWSGHYLKWAKDTEITVMSLLGSGYLDKAGLKHALILACRLDLQNYDVL